MGMFFCNMKAAFKYSRRACTSASLVVDDLDKALTKVSKVLRKDERILVHRKPTEIGVYGYQKETGVRTFYVRLIDEKFFLP